MKSFARFNTFLIGLLYLQLSFISTSGIAQTGPGGVGSSTNNQLWLRIDSNVYTNAGITPATNASSVFQWEDYSGNNQHALSTTASDRPTLRTNQINGNDVLDFDGNNDRILSSGVSTGGNMIVFTVVRPTAFTNNNDGIIQASPSGNPFTSTATDKSVGMWINRSTSRPWGRAVQTNSTQRNITETTTLSSNTTYIITNDYNGSNVQQYVNGSTAGSVTYDGTLKDWSEFGIGRQGTESFTGYIAEVIAYNTTLNPAQRIIIDNYLAAKFGLTLGSGDIYTMDNVGNGNYDFEVAGIGRAASAAQTQTLSQGSGMVIITKSGGGLGNNEYLIWGHEGGTLSSFGYTDVPSGVDARLGRKWRVSEQGEVGDVIIGFDLTGLGPVTTTDLRLLIDSDGDGDFTNATAYAGATSAGGNVYEFSVLAADLEDGDGFTISSINTNQTPLPVELLSFSVMPRDKTVVIEWTTLSEINNEKFIVQRSSDAHLWFHLDSLDGAGNSHEALDYILVDDFPLFGLNYYRLLQRDYNGIESFSAIQAVNLQEIEQLQAYPNPVTSILKVPMKDPENYVVQVFDLHGSIVPVPLELKDSSLFMDFHGVVSGTYLLKLRSGNYSVSQKIVVNSSE